MERGTIIPLEAVGKGGLGRKGLKSKRAIDALEEEGRIY